VHGIHGVAGVSSHVGPEGNSGSDNANGGNDTSVGPIKTKGGFGAVLGSVGHGGMGGGYMASTRAGLSGSSGSNTWDRNPSSAGSGISAEREDSAHWWPGSGGGASTVNDTGVGNGGPLGPFAGGAEGSRTGGSSTAWSGAGGGASIFGPGGAGGVVDANAPAVPSGSYGAGGGGGGGCTTLGGGTVDAFFGADGGGGYVSLFYYIQT
jgi:hypothetical protein